MSTSIRFSGIELQHLLKSWAAISLAFAILYSGGVKGVINLIGSSPKDLVIAFIISGFTVGLGFLLHELAHKFVAQKYGCYAEYRGNDKMLYLAIMLSFFGFIFAAPGAVYIKGHVGIVRNGRISIAGPLSNFILALLFLGLSLGATGFLQGAFTQGLRINAWIGLFNMIPLGNFDGVKILAWNKKTYAGLIIFGFLLLFTPAL